MDTPVVLSHHTAYLFYRAPNRHDALARGIEFGIADRGISSCEIGHRIQRFLWACGVLQQEVETIDVIVSMDFMRIDSSVFRPHAFGDILTERDVCELVPGLCVVREELCFMQAADWMSKLELIEFGYELCGLYEPTSAQNSNGQPMRRTPLTSTDRLRLYADEHPGAKGVKKVRAALVRVRSRARSPMEAALAMMIVLPRKMGGLGYRGIELNYRIDVPEKVRSITTSEYLEVDVYAPKKKVGIEYDGEVHAAGLQRARDAERLSVLAAMGIRMHVVTGHQFSGQLALHRALNAIAHDLGVSLDATPMFQRAQNDLRMHIVRRWTKSAC